MPRLITEPQAPVNRVLSAILLHTEQSVEFRINNPMTARNDASLLQKELNHYKVVLDRYQNFRGLTADERRTRQFLRHEVRRLTAAVYPTLAKRFLYSKVINSGLNWLLGRYRNFTRHHKQLISARQYVATDLNFANISQVMRAHGFDQSLERPLKSHMSHGLSQFTLSYYDIKSPDTTFFLNFKRVPDTDAYYLEGFEVRNRPDWKTTIKTNAPPKVIAVSLLDEYALNAAQASRLAAGRPVETEINGKLTWLTYDAYSPTGIKRGYLDLNRLLDEYPIKEMTQESSRTALVSSLRQGGDPQVTLLIDHETQLTARISLSSDLSNLNFRDERTGLLDMKRILKEGHPGEAMVKSIQTAKSDLKKNRSPRLSMV
jgi:hypothetical protein